MAAAQGNPKGKGQGNRPNGQGNRPGSQGKRPGTPVRGYRPPAKKTNWFAIWVSVASAVVVIAIVAAVVLINNKSSEPAVAPTASNIDTSTGSVSFGTGSNTVDTYIDFLCPYCQQFEESEGDTIQQLIDDGEITLNVHPVTILDNYSSGTYYSSRAAGAFFSVAQYDPASAYAFLTALYENQPEENSTGLTNEELVQIAEDAGVNMTDELESSILNNEYQSFAQEMSDSSGISGTPTVLVNGTKISVTYDAQTDIVDQLN
ncbi:MAG: thioredoxin domain-containing protein [Microbacterium sp.]|uniref:DsbA family protein n=1 Tax=Microbacterium sp. TaxID=51671 RepID=UPI0039E291C3